MQGGQLDLDAGHRLDQHAAPIGRVGDSLNEAGLLQPVDHSRRRAGRKTGQLGQPPNREPALDQQHIQTLDVRS